MRLVALLLCLATPAAAETYDVPSRVEGVTLYPWGAQVARTVTFDAAAGAHRVIVSDLPENVDPSLLRVIAPDGVKVGSVSLASGRQPVTGDRTPPEVAAAKAEVERLEDALRAKENAVELIRLKAEAADAQALFLRSYGKDGSPDVAGADELKALAATIGAEILAARQVALAAQQEAAEADRALKADREALDKAKQALAALTAETETATLSLTVEAAAPGPVALTVVTFSGDAHWEPVYDLRLTRGDTPELVADRGVLVEQRSGEDWLGVQLTLSTARPGAQSQPGTVYPWKAAIVDESFYASGGASYDRKAASAPEMEVAEPAPVVVGDAAVEMVGTIVTYRYPTPVDLRTDVEALRLSLDSLTLTPEVRAVAVPLTDQTAYIVATTRNTTPEILLPGTAQLWLDGELVGGMDLPLVAANAETDIGFGPIDGLRLTRKEPNRSEGDSGVISRSTQRDETVTIEVENLTGEDWPIRVLDRVPYSEQDDLQIRYDARPAPTEENVDGDRGVLAWEFEIERGTKQVISLGYSLKWPTGYVLQ